MIGIQFDDLMFKAVSAIDLLPATYNFYFLQGLLHTTLLIDISSIAAEKSWHAVASQRFF